MPKHLRAIGATLAGVVLTLGLSLTDAQPASAAVTTLVSTNTCEVAGLGGFDTFKVKYQKDLSNGNVKVIQIYADGPVLALNRAKIYTSNQGSYNLVVRQWFDVTGTTWVSSFTWYGVTDHVTPFSECTTTTKNVT